MLKFKIDKKSFDEFEKLCDLPAKVIPQLKKLMEEPSIFDLKATLNEALLQSFWDATLSYQDYLGIKDQFIAISEGYDVI